MALADPEKLLDHGVRALLGELGGYRLGVVSSARGSHLYPLLEVLGLRERFDTIVCREDVTELKPSPEPYLTAARRLGVSRVLVVEDSDAGAESGRAAGFDVLMIPECSSMARLLREAL
jgi:HAD superfamily hydrolase (TIGR01509 family)